MFKVWPEYGKNRQDVAELWIGFLDFYSQNFDFKTDVVTIRAHRRLTKLEKAWGSDTLAIEDPFDLKRDLGSRLTKKSEHNLISNVSNLLVKYSRSSCST